MSIDISGGEWGKSDGWDDMSPQAAVAVMMALDAIFADTLAARAATAVATFKDLPERLYCGGPTPPAILITPGFEWVGSVDYSQLDLVTGFAKLAYEYKPLRCDHCGSDRRQDYYPLAVPCLTHRTAEPIVLSRVTEETMATTPISFAGPILSAPFTLCGGCERMRREAMTAALFDRRKGGNFFPRTN